jgi:hypothetical protein
MKTLGAIAIALCTVPLALAGVEVEETPGVDIASHRTYAWRTGTPAAQQDVQDWIVEVVERELAGRGYVKAEGDTADMYVKSYAGAEMGSDIQGGYVYYEGAGFGVVHADPVLSARGVLVVELLDGQTEQKMWRGKASEMMTSPTAEKARKVIERVSKKMFRSLPKRPEK